MSTYILSLCDARATLDCVGGKGMSLAKLAREGLPVPDGFHVTTEAYRRFVSANEIQPKILEAVAGLDTADTAALESASGSIAGLFREAEMPGDLAEALLTACSELRGPQGADSAARPLAVRSSATAEDLPEASFAGQQESYLNVRGPEAVLDAVRKCWASLWTARAIAYRARQGIAPEAVALAVVVQELVCAEAAGVMFTANPINGRRGQVMITATWGLGEAIVSGAVTPDTLILDKGTRKLVRRETADKRAMTIRTEAGTQEAPVPGPRRKRAVLNDTQARELCALGERIEALYEAPMDIEWALAQGKFAIVQARPITALPDEATGQAGALEWPLPRRGAVLARGSFAEFVPEPVSPLFATLAVPIAREETVRLMGSFGMRERDSYLMEVLNDYVYVGFVMTPRFIWKMLTVTVSMTGKLLKESRQRGERARAELLEAVSKWQGRDVQTLGPMELLAGAREIFRATAACYTVAQSGPIPAALMGEMTFSKYYDLLVKRKGDPKAARLLFGTENHAVRSEKALYDVADCARSSPGLESYLKRAATDEICAALEAATEPAPGFAEFAGRFRAYLAEYGHAIYDMDFAKPVPAEVPGPLLETLKIYLSGQNNPYERQQAAVEFREQAAENIARRLDPLRRKYFLKLLKSAQDTAPLRENSIADVGLGHPQMRRMLGELGRRLAEGGAIAGTEDIYWLELAEAESLAGRLERGEALHSLAGEVAQRKAKWQAMRHITPPTTLPKVGWMSAFYPDNEASGATLKGFGASAGRVTGRACVMLGPEDFGKMQPGDVIVAGITTPAWTPLFARAAAIVTDIGGPLSHSSIVAREYGIPAVLATGVGTRRIKDGQRLVVDGSAGTVTLLARS